ncbi:MAG TPA: MlaD family protein [Longimicrobiales bacterium]|nr:MlaD family protein [Longimicrobiales bacterium]
MARSRLTGRGGVDWRQIRVGALIVLSVLLLAYATYRVGATLDLFARRYEVVMTVPSGLGLREGAPVTLAGQRVGQVQRIEFIPVERKTDADNLRVILGIAQNVRDQVRTDSRAYLRTQGLLGDKFIDISPGSVAGRVLQPGDEIVAGRSLDLDEFMMQASDALAQATDIVGDLQQITGALVRGDGTVGRMLHDDALYASLTGTTLELRRTLAEINRADGTFGRLIRDPELYQQLSGAVTRVDSLGGLIMHGNGTLGMLLRDDALYERALGAVDSAGTAITGLGAFVRQMSEGEGALQRLLADPELYEEFLRAVVDVQTLINDIRLNPGKYKPNILVDIF